MHTLTAHTETNGLSPPPLGPKLCYGCKKPIEDDYRLSVSPDLEWHMDCLTCAECQQCLDESCTCFIKNGRPYCKKDYVRYISIIFTWYSILQSVLPGYFCDTQTIVLSYCNAL